MTDTDMLYMASLEKRNAELEARVAELEKKHWNECRQIAHYSDELAEAKELLKLAIQDLASALHYVSKFTSGALIGEDTNVPASNVGQK